MLYSLFASSLFLVTAVAGAAASANSKANVGLVRRAEASKLAARQFGAGMGFGGASTGMSSSSFTSSQTTQVSSISSLVTGYSSLVQEIMAAQSMISAGGIGVSIAMQQIEQLAVQFQLVFSEAMSCGCLGAGAGMGSMISVVSQVFMQFQSLMGVVQQVFPGQLGTLFGPSFGGLSGTLSQFLSIMHTSGVSISSIVPNGFGSILSQAGLGSTANAIQSMGCMACM